MCTGQIPIKWVYCRSGRLRRGEYQIYHLEQPANTICLGLKKKCLGLTFCIFSFFHVNFFQSAIASSRLGTPKIKYLKVRHIMYLIHTVYYTAPRESKKFLEKNCIQCSDGRLGPRSSFAFALMVTLRKSSL